MDRLAFPLAGPGHRPTLVEHCQRRRSGQGTGGVQVTGLGGGGAGGTGASDTGGVRTAREDSEGEPSGLQKGVGCEASVAAGCRAL